MRVDQMYRNVFAMTWSGFCIAALAIVLALYYSGWVGDVALHDLLWSLNRAFAPYLGVVISFYLVRSASSTRRTPVPASSDAVPFVAAMLTSVIWNAVMLLFLVMLATHKLTVKPVVDGIDQYNGMLSWLAAPGIGFYFASRKGQ